jgi:hypothetical protein
MHGIYHRLPVCFSSILLVVVIPVVTMSIFETGTIESAYGQDLICYQLYITYLFLSEYYIIE